MIRSYVNRWFVHSVAILAHVREDRVYSHPWVQDPAALRRPG